MLYMNRNRRNPPGSRSKQKGLTLIELAIVIAIVAIIIFGVFLLFSRVQTSRIATDEAQNLNMMMADVRSKFGTQGSFNGITPTVMINLGLVPRTMINGNNIRNGWNTNVTVAAVNLSGTAGDGVEFTYQVPREACADFVTSASGAASRITVGGTVVKNVTAGQNTVNVATLGTQCNADAGGNVPVLLAQGR